eukprot:1142749-Pelagomonas_calceolata.AAC.1
MELSKVVLCPLSWGWSEWRFIHAICRQLELTANDPGAMQVMLNRLWAYSMRKGLTVNTPKPDVMHLIVGRVLLCLLGSSTFMHGDVALPENSSLNTRVSEEHAMRPYMAAQQRIKEFVHEHNLWNRPHALIWLSKVHGIPDGMYACQVWGTEHL